jgi:DIS3-like exonuclease 2
MEGSHQQYGGRGGGRRRGGRAQVRDKSEAASMDTKGAAALEGPNNTTAGRGRGGNRSRKKRNDSNDEKDTAASEQETKRETSNKKRNANKKGAAVPERSNINTTVAADRGQQASRSRKKRNNKNEVDTATVSQEEKGKSQSGRNNNDKNKKRNASKKASTNNNDNKKQESFVPYPSYWSYSDCLALYASKDPTILRGKLRVLPGREGKAFVTCDRGEFQKDVLVETTLEQNRALDGDTVFVELYPEEEESDSVQGVAKKLDEATVTDAAAEKPVATWQDDDVQRRLWNPQVVIAKPPDRARQSTLPSEVKQRKGKVVHVVMPKETAGTQPSELAPSDKSHLDRAPRRTIVGRLDRMRRKHGGDVLFLTPNNKSLPQFACPRNVSTCKQEEESALFKAEYVYGSWKESQQKPPCINVQQMGMSCNVQDETLALLVEFDVNHGDFPAPVLKDVEAAVESGMELLSTSSGNKDDMGWRPTPEMYKGRRDYRNERIFTIDPTTAKDLDDALHVKALPDGRVEIGVHIADVSHFVQPDTAVDKEAARRATTVYLVDRTVPMLPRPLCEIACSLNENVERLAFSCVWRMNMDGSVESPNGKKSGDEVWYGRTVIKSCARLDYATAQNIIEGKVANGERAENMDESLWPKSRRPSGRHTVDQVASDVRLMNRVAQARRRLRFQNGAVALNGVKLAFQLDEDGETPMLCAPYPLRDSNRLVEEYMLLANYFVAQRLITHAGGLALLRHHPPPLMEGIEKVVDVAKRGIGFDIDPSSSRALQSSLSRLGRECSDELVMQCVTEMLMTPMKPAEYMAAGSMEPELWRHFALNIPFYTHFTSPIRRYPDVIVHRLLQATLDGEQGVDAFPMDEADVQSVSSHCNDKRMASKKAQDRSDRVFLALYLRRNPLKGQLGVVLSVGEKTFSVFVPSLGASVMLFLDEHKDMLTFEPYSVRDERRISLVRKGSGRSSGNGASGWTTIDIKVFTKLAVSCHCKEKAPIDVRLKLEGPWNPR